MVSFLVCNIFIKKVHFLKGTFSLNWPTGPIQSLSCDVRLLCVCHVSVPLFAVFKHIITPIYKGPKSNGPIAEIFLREKI